MGDGGNLILKTSRRLLVCKLIVAATFLGSQYLNATEFIVVQLPHAWIIGADSKESVTNGYSHSVNKILPVGRFVVLRYGNDGSLGDKSFDLDAEINRGLKDKATEAEAFETLKQLFNAAEQKVVDQHKLNKLTKDDPTIHVMSDPDFVKSFAIGFVLLSVENGKPLIEDYHLIPTLDMEINWWTAGTISKARELYKPAFFSVPEIPSAIPQSVVEATPAKIVRQLLKEVGDNPAYSFGVGPPYVVARFDGQLVSYIDDAGKALPVGLTAP
jgi:hypothetical protein